MRATASIAIDKFPLYRFSLTLITQRQCSEHMQLEQTRLCTFVFPLQFAYLLSMLINQSLCTPWRSWRLSTFLPLALDGVRSASRPGALPVGKDPSTYWTGGWVGFKSSSNALQKRETLMPLPVFEQRFFGRPVRGLVTISTALSALIRTFPIHVL